MCYNTLSSTNSVSTPYQIHINSCCVAIIRSHMLLIDKLKIVTLLGIFLSRCDTPPSPGPFNIITTSLYQQYCILSCYELTCPSTLASYPFRSHSPSGLDMSSLQDNTLTIVCQLPANIIIGLSAHNVTDGRRVINISLDKVPRTGVGWHGDE